MPVSVGFRNFGLKLILVASDNELFSVVVVLIWREKHEDDLGNLSAIIFIPFEIKDNPSTREINKIHIC